MTRVLRVFRSVALGASEVAANPLRSFLLILSITIAIFTTHVVFSLALQTEHDLDRLVRLTQGTKGTYSLTLPRVISPQEIDLMLEPLTESHSIGVAAQLGEANLQVFEVGHTSSSEALEIPESVSAELAVISPLLTEVFLVEFLNGRWPSTQLAQSAVRPVIVSEDFAGTLEYQYDLANVVGQRISFEPDENATSVVVGVVANSAFTRLVGSDIYVPAGNSLDETIAQYSLLLNKADSPTSTLYYANHDQTQVVNEAIIRSVQGALRIHGLPDLDISASAVGGDEAFGQAQKTMSLVFRVIAIIVLVIGIMPVIVVSFSSIRARSREIGLRQAMGMTGAQTLVFVISEILIIVGAGIVGGVMVALLATPQLIAQLIGESETAYTNDALWTSAIAALLTALVLGWLPARAATKNDAMQLLN